MCGIMLDAIDKAGGGAYLTTWAMHHVRIIEQHGREIKENGPVFG